MSSAGKPVRDNVAVKKSISLRTAICWMREIKNAKTHHFFIPSIVLVSAC
jgi:hypothetical protein